MRYLSFINKHVQKQTGKIFVITGATSGLGLECSRQLLYEGAKVVMACRNIEKANKTKEEFLKEFKDGDIEILKYDQADFSSIEEFANSIKDRDIDCLVLNAGIYHPKNGSVTKDGYPLTVGTNYIGVYYLLEKLETSFKNNKIKRVVVTSSIVRHFGHTKHFEKHLLTRKKGQVKSYNVSKYFDHCLAGNLKAKYPDLEVVLTHPGLAKTNIFCNDGTSYKNWFKKAGRWFMTIFANSAEKSAICTLIAATKQDFGDLDMTCPRGFFHLIGYPKIVKCKLEKIKNEPLELATKEIVNN